MTWWQWVLVGVAGAVGAPLRYVVDTLVGDRLGSTFPMGTLVVNVSGSFALGLISGLVLFDGLGSGPNVVVGSGLVGAYTTFSTWTFETMALVGEGELGLAVRNVGVSAVVGAAAAAAGMALAGV
jgi:fluoride exporter